MEIPLFRTRGLPETATAPATLTETPADIVDAIGETVTASVLWELRARAASYGWTLSYEQTPGGYHVQRLHAPAVVDEEFDNIGKVDHAKDMLPG
ncbi:MAG: hypothetical protein H6641_15705 [Caldilineaceae bacterium]|nr:hypothetical protein [Caldilineaceae bacterium]